MTLQDIAAYVRRALAAYAESTDENAWYVRSVQLASSYEAIEAAGAGRWVYGWCGTATRAENSDGLRVFKMYVPVYVRCRCSGDAATIEATVLGMAHDVITALIARTSAAEPVRDQLRIEQISEAIIVKGAADLLIEGRVTLTIGID